MADRPRAARIAGSLRYSQSLLLHRHEAAPREIFARQSCSRPRELASAVKSKQWRRKPRNGDSNSRLSGTVSVNERRCAKTGHRLNAAQADIASLASASACNVSLAAACISVPWFTAVRSFGNGLGWLGGLLRQLGPIGCDISPLARLEPHRHST